MLVWFMALLGILTSFLVKFMSRKDKQKEPSLDYWVKDNYPELITSFLFMVMLIIIGGKIEFDESAIVAKLPFIKSLPLDLIFAAIVGYYNNILWYAAIKKLKGK